VRDDLNSSGKVSDHDDDDERLFIFLSSQGNLFVLSNVIEVCVM
jgi:hypothetical protein